MIVVRLNKLYRIESLQSIIIEESKNILYKYLWKYGSIFYVIHQESSNAGS